MPIRSRQDRAFTPEEAQVLVDAFGKTLKELGLVDRDDPVTRLVAGCVIDLAEQGERDPQRLRDLTVKTIQRQQRG